MSGSESHHYLSSEDLNLQSSPSHYGLPQHLSSNYNHHNNPTNQSTMLPDISMSTRKYRDYSS
jgi:hypothetical protein